VAGHRTLALLLALAGPACTCAPSPGPPTASAPGAAQASTRVAVKGRVVPPAPGEAPDRVALVPAGPMSVHVEAKLAEATAGLDRLSGSRATARADFQAALLANDRANQEWKQTNDEDLYRRVEVQIRRRSAAEAAAVHEELLRRKKAAYARTVKAARLSDQREVELRRLDEEAKSYRAAMFLVEGMPAPVAWAEVAPDGTFSAEVEPGRYALVAVRADGAGDAWLVWADAGAAPREVQLDGTNRHGSDCDACVAHVRRLP
jgi:hypothetical protein